MQRAQLGENQGSAPTVVLAVAPTVVAGHAAAVPAAVYLPDPLRPLAPSVAPAPLAAVEQPLKVAAGGRSGSPGTRPPPPNNAGEAGPALPPPARWPVKSQVEVGGQEEISLFLISYRPSPHHPLSLLPARV